MRNDRLPRPILILGLIASFGIGWAAATLWAGAPPIGSLLLAALAAGLAILYPRRVAWGLIALGNLTALPATALGGWDTAATFALHLGGTLVSLAANEARLHLAGPSCTDTQAANDQQHLNEVMRFSPAVLYRGVPDPTGPSGWEIVYNSPNVVDVIGYSPEELAADPMLWLSRVHPEDQARMAADWDRSRLVAASQLGPVTSEYRFYRRDGALIWLQDLIRVVCDDAGEPIEFFGHTVDISARKAVEAVLIEERRVQDESIRNSPAILFRARPDPGTVEGWEFVYHSANTIDVLGYTVDEIAADPHLWLNSIHPDDLERSVLTPQMLAAIPATQTMPIVYDYRFRHKAGHYIWIQNSLRIQFDADSRPTEMFGLSVDITTRKLAEEALEASQKQLAEVVQNNPAALFHAIPDEAAVDGLRYIYHSSNVAQVTGLTSTELDSGIADWTAHIHPDDRRRVQQVTRVFALGLTNDDAPLVQTYRFKHSAGHEIWLQDTLRPIRDTNGRVREVIGQSLDVTIQRRMELALRQAEERLQHIVNNSPMTTYTLQLRGTGRLACTFMTDNVEILTGFSAAEILNDPALWRSRIHPEDHGALWSEALRSRSTSRSAVTEYRFVRRDGAEIWIEDTSHAIVDADGQLREIIGQLQDVTPRKEAQRGLEDSQRFISQLAGAIPSQVFVVDLITDEVVYANREHAELLSFAGGQPVGQVGAWLRGRVHPDETAQFDQLLEELKHSADDDNHTACLRVRDNGGEWRDVQFRYRVFQRAADGRPIQLLGLWDDFTDARRSEQALADSQRLLSRLTQALPSVTYVIALTPDGALDAFRYVNRPMTELLGYPAGAPGQIDSPQAWAALIHPDDRDGLMQQLGEMNDMAEGEICETEFRMRGADGGWRWVSARHMVFQRDPSGRVTEIVGAIDDITRARHAQEELAANQRLLSRIAEAVPSTLYVLDVQVPAVNGGLLYSNRSLALQLGHLEPASAESSWLHFLLTHLHPEDVQTFAEMLRRQLSLSEGEVLETEYRLQDGDGAWHWMRARDLVFERDSKGAVTQIIGVVEDVTASRHLQDEVRSERDFAQLVLNTLGQGVAVITPAGVCEYINPAGARILGYDPGALVGVDLTLLVPNEHQRRMTGAWAAADELGRRQAEVIEIPYTGADGRTQSLLLTITPRVRQGEPIGTVAVFSDVSERKSMELQLSEANRELAEALDRAHGLAREAQAANHAKSEFLANMSHEIRTPMNAVLGLAEHLQESGLKDDQNAIVKLISESGQALLQIINDILDFSKIEAGRLELDPAPFNLAVVIEGVVDLLTVRAREKGLRLATHIDAEMPLSVIGDSGRIRQVLLNLVGNAVKFTEQGAVTIQAVIEPIGERMLATIVIDDTGIGIAPDAIERLFSPFEQAETGTNRRFGGTGLGLAIVKRLLDLMGGAIALESEVGVGTTLTLTIPFERAPNVAAAEAIGAGHGRLLIVEPDAFARDVLVAYATAAGYSCDSSADPATALAQLRMAGPYTAWVLGLWADDAATQDLLNDVRNDPELDRLHRIIVSAEAVHPDLADAWVPRPVKRAALAETLARDGSNRPISSTRSPIRVTDVGQLPDSGTAPLVLLAEDNPINQRVAVLQLEKLGYRVEIALDGQAAVATYQEAPGRYRLILMDCQMPVLDGFEATRHIRLWEAAHRPEGRVPIVAMTANAMAGDRELCLAAGMDDYLSKPVTRQALADALAHWLPATALHQANDDHANPTDRLVVDSAP